jgi:hypothetical protein
MSRRAVDRAPFGARTARREVAGVCLFGSDAIGRADDTDHVIADVDATIAAWLGRLAPELDVTFTPPADKPASTAKRAPTTLTAFLYDVREDPDAGTPGWTGLRGDDGVLVGRQHPSRAYRFSYLLIASGADPLDEHEALGRVLTGSLLNEVVAEEDLAGQLKAADGPVLVRCAPAARSVDARDLWAAWGIRPRTSLELSVSAPMPPPLVLEVAEPPSHVDLGARRLSPAREAVAVDGPPRGRTTQVREE